MLSLCVYYYLIWVTLTAGKEGSLYLWLVSSLTGLYLNNEENMLLFVCNEAVEFKQVKL